MQAITVKVLPATNHKPTRFKASCDAGSATVSHDYSGDGDVQARRACRALLMKLDWAGTWGQGGVKGGWVFVNVAGSSKVRR